MGTIEITVVVTVVLKNTGVLSPQSRYQYKYVDLGSRRLGDRRRSNVKASVNLRSVFGIKEL